VKQALYQARFLFSVSDARMLAPARAEVAFVGRSNCGKSSVINAVCRQAGLARVSKTPGRTRTINVFETTHLAWIVDLPGYGYAVGPAASRRGWKDMIEGYLMSRPSLQSVFLIVDAKVGATPLDVQMVQWLVAGGLAFRVLANKVDQIGTPKHAAQRRAIASALETPESNVTLMSARTGAGIQALQLEVAQRLAAQPPTSGTSG
jgi:GTP-binding protein